MREFFRGWRRTFWLTARVLVLWFGGLALFGIGEAWIRSLARKPIVFVFQDNLKVAAEGYVVPDFLWLGKAWWVDVSSDTPITLDFDRRWTANTPVGKHQIRHSHDGNNTTDYSKARWWEAPTIVTVSKR